jgi:GTP diphosphokinase / guanosine-3',5'-bis(diphosphate) 3'-diphosphatase
MHFSADTYLHALHFAARAHGEQKNLMGMPYVVHLCCVAAELSCALREEPGHDEALAVTCALLHDVVEDTSTTLEQVATAFGPHVAAGVSALTKNASLPPARQMPDSLERILQQPSEVAMVKLSDRITNTAAPPPQWSGERIARYRSEAEDILAALGYASPFLAERLRARINAYAVR